ncbi:MAG: hypothetical protein P8J61_09915 [Gammaproteobacteria bacterium]|jgi:hypothetical protein|nr:hypothetical protein [Gammaproteobacteria bacterium]
MVDRRTALKISAAGILSGLVNLPGQSLANASKTSAAFPTLALFDGQYIESQAFADTLKNKNMPITDIQGDLSKLWYSQLRQQLLIDRSPLVGLTTRLDLFCLEELARDVGMSVSLRFDHLISQNGTVEHQINGSYFSGLGDEAGFGTKMADISVLNQTTDISAQKLTGPYAPLNKTALVTWIIS